MSAARRKLEAVARARLDALARELAGHPAMAKAVAEVEGAWMPADASAVLAMVLADALNELDIPGVLESAGGR